MVLFTLTIPGPCTPKGRPKITTIGGHARAFTPKKTATYESYIRQLAASNWRKSPLDCAISFDATIYVKAPKTSKARALAMRDGTIRPTTRPDLDNYIKAILDGLNGVVFADDSQIVTLVARKLYDDGNGPRVEIQITDLNMWR